MFAIVSSYLVFGYLRPVSGGGYGIVARRFVSPTSRGDQGGQKDRARQRPYGHHDKTPGAASRPLHRHPTVVSDIRLLEKAKKKNYKFINITINRLH